MSSVSLIARLAESKTQEEVSDILYSLGEEGDVSVVEPLATWLEAATGEVRQMAQQAIERIRARLPPQEKTRVTEVLEEVRRRGRARSSGDSTQHESFSTGGRKAPSPPPRSMAPPPVQITGPIPRPPAGQPPRSTAAQLAAGEQNVSSLEVGASAISRAGVRAAFPVKPYAARLSQMLQDAVQKGASDVHLRSGQPPCYRVDGKLVESGFPVAEPAAARWLIYRLLDESRRAAFDQGEEQDLAAEKPGLGRFRVNVFQDLEGPGMVIRILEGRIRTLQELQCPSVLERFCKSTRGLILVTGPTGCGKSTTVAAMLDYINEHREGHIVTIEDPVEFVHKSKKCRFTQREVGSNTKSFGSALRAALRQDPDVIMVGEMRDLETMELAMTAAETGHLVLSTLHTQTAPKTLDRILGAFPANRADQVRTMLAESLLAVVCQVLLPKARGAGRVAAHEVMFRVPAIANLIREGKIFQIPNAMLASLNQGMRLLDENLANLVKSGEVAFDDAMAVAVDPEALRHRSL